MPLPTPTFIEQYDARSLSTDEAGDVIGQRAWKVDYGDLSAASNGDMDTIETHIAAAIGINRFDGFPGQPLCMAQSATFANDGAKHLWKATYGYSSKFDRSSGAGNANVGELTADGLEPYTSGTNSTPGGWDKGQAAEARPYQIKTTKRTVTKILEEDAQTAVPVINSAGDPFDPPLEVERTYLGYQITFFRYYSNLRWTGTNNRPDFLDKVNGSTFKVFGRSHAGGTLRVSDVSMTLVWDKDGSGNLKPICQIDVELLYNPARWVAVIMDFGRRAKTGGGEPLKPIVDESGQPVPDPYPLDGAGYKLGAGLPFVPLEFWEYDAADIRELFT